MMLRNRLMAACDHVTPERNIELVAAIAAEFPHNIVALPSAHDLARYTCLVHALGFTEQPRYVAVAALHGHDVYAGTKFAEWLLAGGALKGVQAVQAPIGTVVVYFNDDGGFTHAGLVAPGGRVQSKWGVLGLYEHDVFEAPSNYGKTVRYFEYLPYEQAIELFYDFAKENGVEFQEDATNTSLGTDTQQQNAASRRCACL